MDFDEYQRLARRTNGQQDSERSKLMCSLGIAGEAGEAIELVKKELFHERPMQVGKLVNELGDILWYIANLSYEYNIPLSQIVNTNIEKLKLRYPGGFTVKDANKDHSWEAH